MRQRALLSEGWPYERRTGQEARGNVSGVTALAPAPRERLRLSAGAALLDGGALLLCFTIISHAGLLPARQVTQT